MAQANQAVKTRLREEYEVAREKAAHCREEWRNVLHQYGSGSPEEQVAKEAMRAAYGAVHTAYRQSKDWRYL